MKLFKYKNYEDYKKNQIEANIRKINNSYVDPNSLHSLLNYLVEDLKINPKLILCHGTRRGLEQQYIIDFLKYADIGIEDLDTIEISKNDISQNAAESVNEIFDKEGKTELVISSRIKYDNRVGEKSNNIF